MKRVLPACVLVFSLIPAVFAESLPSQSGIVFGPDTQANAADAGMTVSNPAATPIPIDPIDKPTPTPAPTPNYMYTEYRNERMGISFSIPYTWLLNPSTNQDTTVQFVEPKAEMMDENGYQTRITIEKVNRGYSQTAADARSYLETTLDTLGSAFSSFIPGNIASASLGKANGAYCYYKAEYNDGSKTYTMNGRIMIVAQGNALYQIRLTAPRAWYSYYEYAFRKARQTFKFL